MDIKLRLLNSVIFLQIPNSQLSLIFAYNKSGVKMVAIKQLNTVIKSQIES